MIDLHSHTNESDGTCSPAELIGEAVSLRLEALAITDHDTFAGYEHAAPVALAAGIELIRGIELSTKMDGTSVHLLGYFLGSASNGFDAWVKEMQRSRRDRNIRLAMRLRELGIQVTVEEAEAKGRGLTGRPHFAQVMFEKGYVSNIRQAFDDYLDESAKAYVYRREPNLIEAIQKIRDAGGIASLAHPGRIKGSLEDMLPRLCEAGLNALEAYHSDHSADEVRRYERLAGRFGLLVTGGSDYHGSVTPHLRLGTGQNGNLHVPKAVLEDLRAAFI